MRASERERIKSSRLPLLDAPRSDMSADELRAWVKRQPREVLEGIVLQALKQASAKRPRL